jgi:hypothetical protein
MSGLRSWPACGFETPLAHSRLVDEVLICTHSGASCHLVHGSSQFLLGTMFAEFKVFRSRSRSSNFFNLLF